MFEKILVGIDGSEHSFKAAQMAGELARKLNAESVRVVACYEPLVDYATILYMEEIASRRIGIAEANVKRAIEEIGEVAVAIESDLCEGTPAESILMAAKKFDIDLIVMGTRGLGQLAGLLLGSQSQKVVAHADCPVLLVR